MSMSFDDFIGMAASDVVNALWFPNTQDLERAYQDSPGYAHRDASPTELAGAFAAKPGRGERKRRIYEAIKDSPSGLTLHEIVRATGIPINSVCSCKKSLERDRLVKDSGTTRLGPTGSPNILWIAR